VLRIVQNQAAGSAKTYYSHAAYYNEGQELAGIWGGKAAECLGLRGAIEQRDFDALCDNLNPSTGERLTARTKSNRTVGYDYNFHVPKGVSLAYALSGDERILSAFQDGVRETMEDVERDAETRVRVGPPYGQFGLGRVHPQNRPPCKRPSRSASARSLLRVQRHARCG
jgi:hypothetical protein